MLNLVPTQMHAGRRAVVIIREYLTGLSLCSLDPPARNSTKGILFFFIITPCIDTGSKSVLFKVTLLVRDGVRIRTDSALKWAAHGFCSLLGDQLRNKLKLGIYILPTHLLSLC